MADGDRHVGVAIDAEGIRLRQPQMHPVARHAWATSHGDDVMTLDLDWGRLAIVVGDDVVHPEVARLAALASVDVIALPLDAQEPWELPIGVVERAAENRMNAVAANRPGGPLGDADDSVAADLPPDFTLWAPSRERRVRRHDQPARPDLVRTTTACWSRPCTPPVRCTARSHATPTWSAIVPGSCSTSWPVDARSWFCDAECTPEHAFCITERRCDGQPTGGLRRAIR